MVVGFTITYAISVYDYYKRVEFESRSWQCVLDTTLCDKGLKLVTVCDLRQVESGVKYHIPNPTLYNEEIQDSQAPVSLTCFNT